tara:strand:+ start:51730 stop:52737 length:1008 start_codon:yes stop_codon:yes gene_type:complete
MHTPLVSILIPFKNTASFLEDCLESILQQTLLNWELLIVDDGSTDNSWSIVQSYAESDSRIHLLSNNGKGIIEALKTAYSQAKGTFVTRMDSDDIMSTNKLQLMQESLQLKGKGYIALGHVSYFSKAGIGAGYKRYETWLNSLTSSGTNFAELYKECVIPSPCWMVYMTDLERCGGFFNDRYPEDYDLAFRFYKQGLKCIPSNEVLHHWRDYVHRTSRVDAHYAENSFLDLKISYFIELSYQKEKELIIWGAGTKGKKIAQLLIEQNIPFDWICDNPKKIGKTIYNQILKPIEHLQTLKQPQCIISVANVKAQIDIKKHLKSLEMKPMSDYFFFC